MALIFQNLFQSRQRGQNPLFKQISSYLIISKIFKPTRRKLSINDCIFDIGVAKIALNSASIMTLIGQIEPCAMT